MDTRATKRKQPPANQKSDSNLLLSERLSEVRKIASPPVYDAPDPRDIQRLCIGRVVKPLLVFTGDELDWQRLYVFMHFVKVCISVLVFKACGKLGVGPVFCDFKVTNQQWDQWECWASFLFLCITRL